MTTILVGNVFPTSLIRRPVEIRSSTVAKLKAAISKGSLVSYWGHENTLIVASEIVGVDLTPTTKRPALTLDDNSLPSLDGESYSEVWVLSPDYTPGFRPAIGVEVDASQIVGWQVLRIVFLREHESSVRTEEK